METNVRFLASYQAIEARMRKLSQLEGSLYTPCPQPIGPVDYIFLCMEPSLDGRSIEEASAKLSRGFLNFLPGGMGTSILHFCIRRYLCVAGQRYHITDLSKGGMPVAGAGKGRIDRWDAWYPVLLDELKLVAKPDARVFAVGRHVEEYLDGKRNFPWKPVQPLVHYSPLASGAWAKTVREHQEAFERFRNTVTIDEVLATATDVLTELSLPHVQKESLERLAKRPLSDSSKKLIFSYKLAFESVDRGRE